MRLCNTLRENPKNWVQRVAAAAPHIPYLGIRKRLNNKLNTLQESATNNINFIKPSTNRNFELTTPKNTNMPVQI